MLGFPGNRQRPSAEEHQHYRLARSNNSLQQFELFAGQVEMGAGLGLAAHVRGLAQRHDHGIGLGGCGKRLAEASLGVAAGVRAFGIKKLAMEAFLQGVTQGHNLLHIGLHHPGAEHGRAIIRQRANKGNGLTFG